MAEGIDIIGKIIAQSESILGSDSSKLASNYRSQEKEKGLSFQVSEIVPQLDEVKEILKLISKESLLELPAYRLGEFNDSIRNVFSYIEKLSNFKFSAQTPHQDQAREFVDFFKHTGEGRWPKTRQFLWPIIIESI